MAGLLCKKDGMSALVIVSIAIGSIVLVIGVGLLMWLMMVRKIKWKRINIRGNDRSHVPM